jgi:hypothetical protein
MEQFIKQVKTFSNIKGKLNSFITFLVFDQSHEEILKFINHKIKLINTIKDTYKKNRALDKVMSIKDDVKTYKNDYFKSKGILYFVGEDFNKIEIKPTILKVCREEFRDNIFYENGDYFETEYIIDILTNFNFYNLVLIDKKSYLYHINKNKTKLLATVNKQDESELLKEISNKFYDNFIVGGNNNFKNTFCKNNTGKIIAELKVSSFKPDRIDHIKQDALKIYLEKEEEKLLDKLSEYTSNLTQYQNLLLFNNDRILKFLENYLIKTVIVHTSSPIYNQIKELDTDSIELYELSSNDDKCKTFLKDYQGVIAEMRYEMPKESFDNI